MLGASQVLNMNFFILFNSKFLLNLFFASIRPEFFKSFSYWMHYCLISDFRQRQIREWLDRSEHIFWNFSMKILIWIYTMSIWLDIALGHICQGKLYKNLASLYIHYNTIQNKISGGCTERIFVSWPFQFFWGDH